MLGHSSIPTIGIYLHSDEQELEQVASVMPSILNGEKQAGLVGERARTPCWQLEAPFRPSLPQTCEAY